MLIRSLPRSLDPLPGEALDGFLLRLAYRLERPPSRIAAVTGLTERAGKDGVPASLLMHLSGHRREAFARAARLSLDEAGELGLSSMAGQYPPVSPAPDKRGWGHSGLRNHWVFERATRYCPQCLAGDGSTIQNDLGGAWQKAWRLPVVFACITHARFLEHLCPGCARPASDTLTAHSALNLMIPQARRDGLHPTQCRLSLTGAAPDRLDHPACGSALSAPGPASMMPERAAIDLQQRITDLLNPRMTGGAVSCGAPATAREYFVDLRIITQLVRASWPRTQDLFEICESSAVAIGQDHDQAQQKQRRGIGAVSFRTLCDLPPFEARTCAALLTTASRLLQCQRPHALAEQLSHLMAYDQRSPARATWTRDILLRRPDCSPGLRQALAPILQSYTPLPAGRRRRPLRAPVRKTRYKAEHVAQFLQDDWYHRYFADMDEPGAKHLRRAAAIHLCQLAAGGPVRTAANLLGIPNAWAGQSIKILHSWARNNPDPRQFETALRQLADALDAAPHLINYQRRRQALSRWCIDPDTWQTLLTQLAMTSESAYRIDRSDRKRQTASILVWARVTQGETMLAPHPIRDGLPPAAQNSWRISSNTTCARLRAGRALRAELDLKRTLDQYADALAARVDRSEFP